MDTIKVLIIDKNILVRRAITTILQQHKKFRVYWLNDEFDTVEAVIRNKEPDVVLLSIESIEGEGLDILQKIRSIFSNLPVVVVSPRNNEGAKAVITALRLGAIDFITKPESKNLILFAERHLKKRLEPLITAIYEMKQRKNLDNLMLESLTQPQRSFEEITPDISDQQPIEVVVMGGCTGGVQALFSILSSLPKDLAMPVVVVQHLPRTYTEYLATCLDAFCQIPVREVQDGDKLTAGTVYIAPGGYQCEITQSVSDVVASVYRGPRENDMRPSIDVLFRSVAKIYGTKTLGILLSGCGYDGLAGAEEIKKHSGQIIVQDPRSSIAPNLPLSAISQGLTKTYFPPQNIAQQITKYSSLTDSDYYNPQEKDVINANFLF
jgi:two-component system chemotaxis response regulator CheB